MKMKFPLTVLMNVSLGVHWRRKEREAREREEAWQQQQREEEVRREEASADESHSQEEKQPEKRPRTERSDIETKAAGREVGPSQSHYKKEHITNIYLTSRLLWTL